MKNEIEQLNKEVKDLENEVKQLNIYYWAGN